MVCKDTYPLFFKFRVLPSVSKALSPVTPSVLLPPGFLGANSLLFHPSLLFVMAFFKTAVDFLTLDRFPRFWGGQNIDKNTVYIVCFFLHHQINETRKSLNSFSHPPFFHLFINSFVFWVRCRTLATEFNKDDFGEPFPLNRLKMESMVALLTTS